jgi:sulfite exporter TauE/SafE
MEVPHQKKYGDLLIAIPVGFLILVLFLLLQKSDLLSFGVAGKITPATSFIIGLIASVSSCLAIVGGLVLSLSTQIAQYKSNTSAIFILFHAGRIIGYGLLGGILGEVGGLIGINFTLASILGIIASLVMFVTGLHLLDVINNKITIPAGLFSFFRKTSNSVIAPFILGIGTFFLPCGFTQSMQFAALGSGSFLSGLLIMVSFALGTFPMLALLSFGSAAITKSPHTQLFLKIGGVIISGLGLFALLSGLTALGIINPLLNF